MRYLTANGVTSISTKADGSSWLFFVSLPWEPCSELVRPYTSWYGKVVVEAKVGRAWLGTEVPTKHRSNLLTTETWNTYFSRGELMSLDHGSCQGIMNEFVSHTTLTSNGSIGCLKGLVKLITSKWVNFSSYESIIGNWKIRFILQNILLPLLLLPR